MDGRSVIALCLVPSAISLLACGKPPPKKDAPALTLDSAMPSASASAAPLPYTPCGPLDCRAYDDLPTAFEATLASSPLVVAVGEAHGKKGLEAIDDSAKRFTQEIVPTLEGRVSDLLLELMAGAEGCEQAKKGTSEKLAEIGKNQAPEAPNEYVVLGKAAEKRGIKVSQLHPSCKDLEAIAKSKSPNLTVLQTIRALITHDATAALATKTDEKMFFIYGGAFHTEPNPPEERAEFSFAAPVAKAAKDRYVSVHLFVREYIDASWDIWEWYRQVDLGKNEDKVLLLHPKLQHYVIITAAAKPGKG